MPTQAQRDKTWIGRIDYVLNRNKHDAIRP